MQIVGIAHVGIRVHNLARSQAFYELLGFHYVLGPVGPEPVAILKHPAGVEINLILNAPKEHTDNVLMDVEEKHAGYTHVALATTSVEEVCACFAQKGIAISEGPVLYPGGAQGVFVRDPDNNVVELYQAS